MDGDGLPDGLPPEKVREIFDAHLRRSVAAGGGRAILFIATIGPPRTPCRLADLCLVPSNALDVAHALCMAFDGLTKSGAFDAAARRVLLAGVAQALQFEITGVRAKG
jgi:hypothetical protein